MTKATKKLLRKREVAWKRYRKKCAVCQITKTTECLEIKSTLQSTRTRQHFSSSWLDLLDETQSDFTVMLEGCKK